MRTEFPDPKLDTACFGSMRWFVGDVPFSTKQDGENAIRLARSYAREMREELASEVSAKIDEVFR